MPKQVLAVGNMDNLVEEWLGTHGCKLSYSSGVHLVTLPEKAQISRAEYTDCFTVSFLGSDGNDLDEYLYYLGGANCYESELELKKE